MGGAVGEDDPQTGHRVPAERTVRQGVTAPGLHRPHVLLRHPSAGDRRTELEPEPVERLDVEHDVRELARAAVLFDVPVDEPADAAGHRLPVGDPRPPDREAGPAGQADLLHRHLQVQFAHAGQQGLPGLRIGADRQRRVLLGEPGQRPGEPPGVGGADGLDRHRHHRLGRRGALQHQRVLPGAQRRPGPHALGARHGDDVAGRRGLDLGVPVGAQAQHPRDALGAARGRVPHDVPLPQGSGIDPQTGQPAGGGGVHLERQCGERAFGVGLAPHLGALPAARHRGQVERGRQVVRHRVQQRFHPLVAVGGAAEHHHALTRSGEIAQGRAQGGRGQRAVLAELLERNGVPFGHGLLQRAASPHRLGAQLRGDRCLHGLAGPVGPGQRAQAEQVDDAPEAVLGAHRQLRHQRNGVQPPPDGGDRGVQVGAGPVHLVDQDDPGHAVPVGLPPHRLALRLDAGHGVQDHHRAVQDTQGALHLVGEVDVARSVDQVDPPALPGAADGGREDGDAPLAFLGVEVGDGGALVHLAAAVDGAGGVQDPLRDGGLAGVDVGEDAQVADVGEGEGGAAGEVVAHGLRPFLG